MRWVLLSLAVCAALTSTSQGSAGQSHGTGGRRIAWDQEALSDTSPASYMFTLYVNGVDSRLQGASCTPTSDATTYDCVAPLPELGPGTHTLQLTASVVIGKRTLQSERSAPLHLTIPPDTVMEITAADRRLAGRVTTAEGVLLQVERVASGLTNPTDLAFGRDGVLFVAERAGTVRVVHNGVLHANPALTLDDVSAARGTGLLSLTLDPGFDRNGLVYIVYAAHSDTGALEYRLARFRHVGGIFGERAVLLNGIPAAEDNLAASVRFGPDGKLYAAFGDIPEGRRNDAASFNGKVLRLNADGTTPADQPAASPIYASGLLAPRGLAWDAKGTLWIIDAGEDGATQLQIGTPGAQPRVVARQPFSLQSDITSIVAYDHALIPGFRGNLLMGATNAGHLLRLRFDPDTASPNPSSTERLLEGEVGPIRVVAVSALGEIYFCTADSLVRIVPN
jgi:hypothetical protein